MASAEIGDRLADPGDADTFRRSVLDPGERRDHAAAWTLHRDLLALRREDPVLGRRPANIDGAVLGARAWLLRFFAEDGDRLLIVNLGPDLTLRPAPEPLVAPLEGQAWQILWSSEAPEYGGGGTPPLYRNGYLRLPAESALVLAPGPAGPPERRRRGK
jgi:maltooligosyltrehalose trehalohydrolase